MVNIKQFKHKILLTQNL